MTAALKPSLKLELRFLDLLELRGFYLETSYPDRVARSHLRLLELKQEEMGARVTVRIASLKTKIAELNQGNFFPGHC